MEILSEAPRWLSGLCSSIHHFTIRFTDQPFHRFTISSPELRLAVVLQQSVVSRRGERADRAEIVAGQTRAIARRAVALREPTERFWLGLDLESESAVIDFPVAVSAAILELAGPHMLSFSAGQVTGLEKANRRIDRVTIGGSYRPVPLVVFQLAYEFTEVNEGGLAEVTNYLATEDSKAHAILLGAAFGF